MPIDFYAMKLSPPCRAVMMAAKQLNIDLNFKTVDLSEGQQLAPEYIKVNQLPIELDSILISS